MEQKVQCLWCGREYTYDSSNKRGHTKEVCNSCTANAARFRQKQRAVAYKGGCCEVCGYHKSLRALSFHHIDPLQKDFAITSCNLRWETVKAELDKCKLLCANCHMEEHERRVGTLPYANRAPRRTAKEGSTVCECGKSKVKKALKCASCAGIARRKIRWPDPEQLLQMMQGSSAFSVSKRLGVTFNSLKKHCILAGIWDARLRQ